MGMLRTDFPILSDFLAIMEGFAMRVVCVADIMAAIDDLMLADLPVAEGICALDDSDDFVGLEEECSTGIDG
jgi:hypothetical protein